MVEVIHFIMIRLVEIDEFADHFFDDNDVAFFEIEMNNSIAGNKSQCL